MLLALVSLERSSVLAKVDIGHLKREPDGFSFTLMEPQKTDDPISEASASYPSLLQVPSLCPIR